MTDKIASIVLTKKTPLVWFLGFSVATMLLGLFLISVTYLFAKGIGIWGVNMPNAWGYAITNFVWWVGIGHAGTLISAILLLLNQKWRNSINRFAEAMTLFAVACAGNVPHPASWGAPGSSTGSFLIRTQWASSRSFAARWCGTCSRYPLTPLFR